MNARKEPVMTFVDALKANLSRKHAFWRKVGEVEA
jgi:hypothetical protein